MLFRKKLTKIVDTSNIIKFQVIASIETVISSTYVSNNVYNLTINSTAEVVDSNKSEKEYDISLIMEYNAVRDLSTAYIPALLCNFTGINQLGIICQQYRMKLLGHFYMNTRSTCHSYELRY